MGIGVAAPAPMLAQVSAAALAELRSLTPLFPLRRDVFELFDVPVVHSTWGVCRH